MNTAKNGGGPVELQPGQVQITITLAVHGALSMDVMEALDDLASVMAVQSEDGLFAGGYPESEIAGDRLADLSVVSQSVRIVDTP